MRHPLFRFAAVVALAWATGCSFGSDLGTYTPPANGDAGNNGNNGNNGVPDTGEDAPDPDTPDAPDTQCEPGTLDRCPDLTGAEPTGCQDGRCTYTCTDLNVDQTGDLDLGSEGDGCECAGVEEVCDGQDNDCDGDIDESFPEQGDCPDTDGVCAGAATSCEHPVCDHAFYELVSDGRYTPKLDGLCDELDNDCDGVPDEDCCEMDFFWPVAQLDGRTYQHRPSVAVSHVGDVAVAWEESDSSFTDGSPDPSVRVRYRVIAPDLNDITGPTAIVKDDQSAVAHWPNIASDGAEFWLTYVESAQLSKLWEVRVLPGNRISDRRELARDVARQLLDPDTAAHDGTRSTVWVQTGNNVCAGGACLRIDIRTPSDMFQGEVAAAIKISSPAVDTRNGLTLVAWGQEDADGLSLGWQVYDGAETLGGGTWELGVDDITRVYPHVSATAEGWAITYQNQTEEGRVELLIIDPDGTHVPPSPYQVDRGGAGITDLKNAAIAGDRNVGLVYHDQRAKKLNFRGHSIGNSHFDSFKTLVERVHMEPFGLDIAREPRTQLLGAVSMSVSGDNTSTARVFLFWINYSGATLCR